MIEDTISAVGPRMLKAVPTYHLVDQRSTMAKRLHDFNSRPFTCRRPCSDTRSICLCNLNLVSCEELMKICARDIPLLLGRW